MAKETVVPLLTPEPPSASTLETYRLTQSFAATLGIQKVTPLVPVKRPERTQWIWVHPDPAWRAPFALIEDKEAGETFLVGPGMLEELAGEWVAKLIAGYMTKAGSFMLWPAKLPDAEGHLDTWNMSALEIVNDYANRWIRVVANKNLGAYEVYTTAADLPAPTWPAEGFEALVAKAFKGRTIDNADHALVKRLRGLI